MNTSSVFVLPYHMTPGKTNPRKVTSDTSISIELYRLNSDVSCLEQEHIPS
jgi:hypothetical protein